MPNGGPALGREQCGNLEISGSREWLVTNGIGGFACGTVAGLLTRRYHGSLVAALNPPGGRTLMLAKLEEVATYRGLAYSLATDRWSGGAVEPQGFRLLEGFHMEGRSPCWTYRLDDAVLEKRLGMASGRNAVWVRYTLKQAGAPVDLAVKVLVNYRDFHSVTRAGEWRMKVEDEAGLLKVEAYQGAVPLRVRAQGAAPRLSHDWYRNFDLALERARGLEERDDHLCCGQFLRTLVEGGDWILEAGAPLPADPDSPRPPLAGGPDPAPAWIESLRLAAAQFLVKRPAAQAGDPEGWSMLAGFPWFSEWSRDTLISLPGLCLPGRPEVASGLLATYAGFEKDGLLPNCFPDAGGAALYNTVDASLWFVHAVAAYESATGEPGLADSLFPVLARIIQAYARGTLFNIHADAKDGLLYAGEPGRQLTWMDAKIGDWVVTPRIGKPIEINALWVRALEYYGKLGRRLGRDTAESDAVLGKARENFARFWNPARNCCFDVLDGPQGNDPTLRPNQIFAVSLHGSLLTPHRQMAVVRACQSDLLTPYGLRSLGPREPGYQSRYQGGPAGRDAAYHQGTVWPWLLGPFLEAHLKVHRDPAACLELLRPLAAWVENEGMGTLPEIFDADPPHRPAGCFSQAWSVAEILRAWALLRAFDQPGPLA